MIDRKNERKSGHGSARKKTLKRVRRYPTEAKKPAAPPSRNSAATEVLDLQRNLWTAGLKVLSRGGKLAASSSGATRITESLQGGLKKLEAVFDQRVLDSLARAFMPSPRELRDLTDRVAKLDAQLRLLSRRRGEK